MRRERDTQGFSYVYEPSEISNPEYEKDNYSVLAAGLANWEAFLNAADKPIAAEEPPLNVPSVKLLAEGFTLGIQEREKWL
jgi:hypothetical protein